MEIDTQAQTNPFIRRAKIPAIVAPFIAVLPNTSLCAIVRDEIVNPAGGIVDFVQSTVPHVEQAVILDTGSKDGTRQALEELAPKHPNLRVIDHRFEGYAKSRNRALAQVKTKRALVLDADERLTKTDYAKLMRIITEEKPSKFSPNYEFRFLEVLHNGSTLYGDGHNPRMFDRVEARYGGKVWEYLDPSTTAYRRTQALDVEIKHFVPPTRTYSIKRREWYNLLEDSDKIIKEGRGPADCPSMAAWKKPNPHRENWR